MDEIDFGKAARTTDIDWGRACKTCVENKEVIKQHYGVEYPGGSTYALPLAMTLAVILGIMVYLFFKVRKLNSTVGIANGPLDARVDTAIEKWLADSRIEEYADYLEGTIELEIIKGGKFHGSSQRTRSRDGRVDMRRPEGN